MAQGEIRVVKHELAQRGSRRARDANSVDRRQHMVDPRVPLVLGEVAQMMGQQQVAEAPLARPEWRPTQRLDQEQGQAALTGAHVGGEQRAQRGIGGHAVVEGVGEAQEGRFAADGLIHIHGALSFPAGSSRAVRAL